MALISCPECGKQISEKALSCINCGLPFRKLIGFPGKPWLEKPLRALSYLMIIILIILIWLGIVFQIKLIIN
ncbi:MAG: zinc-ribbon domain-containing protein [Nitrospina sp.]|jgi:hypothetical protein|nr:zinc-ribbon domain-containing protein [Nitrospina sp.]